MPWLSGTAESHLDLLEQLHDFITDVAAQQPAGDEGPGMGAEAWSVNADSTSGFTVDGDIHFEGVGLAGMDVIPFGIRTRTLGNRWDWRLQGYSEYNAGLAFDDQLNAIPTAAPFGKPYILVTSPTPGSGSITFYFVANGRRVMVLLFEGGITQFMHAGLFRAYGPATPDRYPFPMMILGSQSHDTNDLSDVSNQHAFGHRTLIAINDLGAVRNGFVWSQQFGAWFYDATRASSLGFSGNHFWCTPPTQVFGTSPIDEIRPLGLTEGGERPLHPIEIMANINTVESEIGYIDGLYWGPGLDLPNGTIVTVDGIKHVGFKHVFRTGWAEFSFMRLE